MATRIPNSNDVAGALTIGDVQPVGQYRLDLMTGRWWWSEQVFMMHGFLPGEVVPTMEMILAHKHPDDRERVAGILAEARRSGEPFSCVHRIIDARGLTRTLSVIGQGRKNGEGAVVELMGYFVDLTETQRRATQREATVSIKAAAESRASIEQAKGVLMVSHGLEEEEAFDLLRRRSNDANVRVRDLAAWLMATCRVRMHGIAYEEIDNFLHSPHPPALFSTTAEGPVSTAS